MFKVERLQHIRQYMLEEKQAEVSILSSMLNVSDATIRNDFEELEKEGFITRFHGGAALNAIGYQDDEIHNALQRTTIEYVKAKEELGEVASQLIREKEWIFLGPGTTTYYIAKALAQRTNIHVLTNNLLVANILGPTPTIRTIVLGGHLRTEGLYTLPDDLEKELNGIYLSKAFFSVDGAGIDSGYTISDMNVMNIIQTIIPRCDNTFFAVDHSKYGKRTFMKLGALDMVKNVIINENTDALYKNYYKAHDVELYTASTSKHLSGEEM